MRINIYIKSIYKLNAHNKATFGLLTPDIAICFTLFTSTIVNNIIDINIIPLANHVVKLKNSGNHQNNIKLNNIIISAPQASPEATIAKVDKFLFVKCPIMNIDPNVNVVIP